VEQRHVDVLDLGDVPIELKVVREVFKAACKHEQPVCQIIDKRDILIEHNDSLLQTVKHLLELLPLLACFLGLHDCFRKNGIDDPEERRDDNYCVDDRDDDCDDLEITHGLKLEVGEYDQEYI
jgi:hypothetical protein